MRHNDTTPGHDSFLDIVSNIVGILIILVMVTGVRAKNYKPDTEPTETFDEVQALQDELDSERQVADNRRLELQELNHQIDEVEGLAKARDRQRMALATAAEAMRRKVQERRESLDSKSQSQFDFSRQLADAQAQVAQLESAKNQIESSRPETIKVKALPTPLAKTVRGKEAHFQLRANRIIWIPLEQLLGEFKQDARSKASQLLSMSEFTEIVGPYGGFRLRYTLERQQISPELAMATGAGGQYAQLRRWTLIPTSNTLGETIEEALGPGSRFRRRVASLPPGTTITIWTYNDSFEDFRRVKEDLFASGFDTAGRPLPDGVPIGGSPEGTRSAAQ
jgi:hypothetical protein